MKKLLFLFALALAGVCHSQTTAVHDLLVDKTVRLTGVITPTQISSNQNDYAPTSFSTAATLLLSSDAARDITGLAGGTAGRTVLLWNTGSFTITLKNASGSSTAANRFDIGTDCQLLTKQGVLLSYDTAASRWRIAGAQINPAGPQTIWVPGFGMTPASTNGATSVQTELTAGQPEVMGMSFDPTTEQSVQFMVAMPKSWDLGTFTVQFYWEHPATTVNFGVVWGVQAVAASDADAIAQAFGTAQTVTDTGGTTDTLYVSSATAALTPGGTPANGDLMWFRVYRKAADGSDTLAVAAKLLGVKIIYTTNAPTDQ